MMEKKIKTINLNKIMMILPHRYPFLLLDEAIVYKKGEHGVGIKNVTINEPYFQGHFPDEPIVPGVLIVESCAQLLGITCANSEEDQMDQRQYLASVQNFNFKHKVCPGDRMSIDIKVTERRFNLIQAAAKVKTAHGLVATGILTITDNGKKT